MICITILGCIAVDTEIHIRRKSMAGSSTNPDSGLFNIRSTVSNEHLVFAETLRDWRDPLLHGHEPIPVLLCPRCAICKCESLKDLRNTASHSIHQHHIHDPSCPIFRHQYDRIRTSNKQCIIRQSKRRAISHDPSITGLNTSSSSSSIIKSKSAEHSLLEYAIKQKKSTSKIPVRISTPTSEYSPSSSASFIINHLSDQKTKIPRLILTRNLPSSPSTTTTDDLYERDR
jgi:hypothetical protein